MIVFEIIGTPRPQGSKRHVGGGIMVESSKHVKEWRSFARMCAVKAMQEAGCDPVAKPNVVKIDVQFAFDRPQSHRNAKGLKLNAPVYHTSRPDADKLLRALLDSMTQIVFQDDSQVASIVVRKVYGVISGTFVRVERLT